MYFHTRSGAVPRKATVYARGPLQAALVISKPFQAQNLLTLQSVGIQNLPHPTLSQASELPHPAVTWCSQDFRSENAWFQIYPASVAYPAELRPRMDGNARVHDPHHHPAKGNDPRGDFGISRYTYLQLLIYCFEDQTGCEAGRQIHDTRLVQARAELGPHSVKNARAHAIKLLPHLGREKLALAVATWQG